VAISNRRLLSLQDGQVTFERKYYREAGKSKEMTVSAEEFIRRFLQQNPLKVRALREV
jgi:Putative transposase